MKSAEAVEELRRAEEHFIKERKYGHGLHADSDCPGISASRKALRILESAPPAAERTALKELRAKMEPLLGQAFLSKEKTEGFHIAIRMLIAEIDAASASEGTKSE